MKLLLIVSCIAAAILAGQGYKVEDTNAWYRGAKETMKEMEDQAELQKLENRRASNSSHVGPTDNPHGCDCDDECKELHHSRVPFKKEDKPDYLSYESFPVLCRDAAATFLPSPGARKKYICKQTFDCCRKCNHLFYVCLEVTDKPYGFCMRAAYKCMCDCIDRKSFNELPHKR